MQNQRCRTGGREHCAKQKAFVTLLATAPSPASYRAAKKSHSQLGDFFAALNQKRERREWKGGVSQKQKRIALVGANNVSPLWRAVFKVTDDSP